MNYPQMGAFPHYNQLSDSNNLNKKWYLNKYAGISTSFGFFNGVNNILSAPIGLQLNRRLNNNIYAFAGISAAPAFFNFNRSFKDQDIYKNYPGTPRLTSNGFGMYSRVEAGLMYINDERTFSISGSIGIDRSIYPVYQTNRINTTKQQPFIGSRQ